MPPLTKFLSEERQSNSSIEKSRPLKLVPPPLCLAVDESECSLLLLKIRVNALADRGEGTALRVETAAAATKEREREKESIPQSESLTNRFWSSETKYDRQIQIVKIQMRVKAMLHFRCGPFELLCLSWLQFQY